jgi:predicted DNA-binding protein YlxM (UPF0122 family)
MATCKRVRTERENIVRERAGSIKKFREIANRCESISAISREINTKRDTVYNLLEEFDVDFKTRTERLEEVDDEKKLRRLYVDENLTQQDIADKFNCSRKYIRRMLKKHGIETSTYSTPHDPETIRKMRVSTIENIRKKKGQAYPKYNPDACELIEEYGDEHGYDFQHAENGGEYHIKELGYWVDGYDPKENVVIEVDEPHHFNEDGKLCERDRRRQQEIEEHLNCKFIRIKL